MSFMMISNVSGSVCVCVSGCNETGLQLMMRSQNRPRRNEKYTANTQPVRTVVVFGRTTLYTLYSILSVKEQI